MSYYNYSLLASGVTITTAIGLYLLLTGELELFPSINEPFEADV